MNCPKCKYDMFDYYKRILDGGKSKYCKIKNITSSFSYEAVGGTDWEVECICPKCKTKWTFTDGDY